MSWDWSHKEVGDLYENIHNPSVVSTETIKECIAEFAAYTEEDHFDRDLYDQKMAWINGIDLGHECLADNLWDLVVAQKICDNGGFNAWLCPNGCECHKAPFGLAEER